MKISQILSGKFFPILTVLVLARDLEFGVPNNSDTVPDQLISLSPGSRYCGLPSTLLLSSVSIRGTATRLQALAARLLSCYNPFLQARGVIEMKPELEKLCQEYIANRDEVKKAFKWDDDALHAVCANIFCACGQPANADRLKECHQVIKDHTRCFSGFRSKKIRSMLASMLSLGEKPEERMALVNEYYRLLKRQFRGTEYLVLTSILLTDLADQTLKEETVIRGKEIYRRMNRKHRLLTNKTDSVFAMLMAFSGKTEDELTEETEACYQVLKKRFSNGASQTAAQLFSMAGGTCEEKVQRLSDLFDALTEAGIKYGRSDELAPLAALSLSGTPIPVLAEEIKAADEFLKTQKGFEGSKESEQAKRAMYAVMIVSDQYAGTSRVNVTVMTGTLDMLISKQQASRVSLMLNLLEFAVKLIPESKEETDAETREKEQTDAPEDHGADTPKEHD